jgi:hypothetical protein
LIASSASESGGSHAVIVGMYPRFHEGMVKENADLVKKFG